MDLSVSPDFDALWCYAVTLVAGIWVGVSTVNSLFGNAKIVWLYPQTWILFFAYAAIPPLLFWFLDRTGAINDTSLFAALIIGFGYRQILAGRNESVSTPASITALWSPFLVWADKIVGRVGDQRKATDEAFQELLLRRATVEAMAPNILVQLLDTAKGLTSNLTDFSNRLDALQQQSQLLGVTNTRRKMAELAVNEISLAKNYAKVLRDRGAISKWDYIWNAIGWRNVRKTGPWLLAIILCVALVSGELFGIERRIDYYVWRLRKSNASKLDLYRSKECLSSYLSDPNLRKITVTCIGSQFKRPGNSMDRVDIYLALLMRHRHLPGIVDEFPTVLIEGLRADSTDTRARLHSALLLLAGERNYTDKLSTSLKDWKPADGDSLDQLEDHIRDWKRCFDIKSIVTTNNNVDEAHVATQP